MVFVVVGGWYSAQQLKSELLPNIDLPVVSVVSLYPGAAPDDVRRDVTEPIEKAIAGTQNLKDVTSVSNDSVSFVTAQYEYGTDMEKTQKAVEDGVNALTFPSEVQRPKVGRFNFQDIPVIAYTINTPDQGPDALVNLRRDIEDKLVPDLKAVPGVNSVTVAGGGNKQVVITFDSQKLQKNGLQASTITGLLQANNISFPTGQITTNGQAIPVRVGNQFGSLDDLRNLVVRPEIPAGAGGASGAGAAGAAGGYGGASAGGPQAGAAGRQGAGTGAGAAPGQQGAGAAGAAGSSGAPQAGSAGTTGATGATGAAAPTGTPIPAVKLSDVATVDLANASGDSISRSNGKPSLSLIVYKTQNANTVQVADSVNAKIDELKKTLPGTETAVLFDQSTFIKDSLSGLIREGLLGAILAILVILIFLRSIRSTLVTAVSIPLSVLIAMILLNVFSISLNIMSLAGLAVAIGRVVDDSIVVLENIYRHHFQNGEGLREAAFNGTREVATAITSSTITTVAVFLPLGFIAGLVSEFFRPFAVAVTVSLLASLLVALTVIPVLAMIFLKTGKARYRGDSAPVHVERDTLIQKLYTPTIRLVLRNGWTKVGTLVLAVLLFGASMALVPFIGFTFINIGSDKLLTADVTMKPGTDLQTTNKASVAIEDQIKKNPLVTNYQATLGSDTSQAEGAFGSLGSASVAKLTITLDPKSDVKQQAEWLRQLVSGETKNYAIDNFTVSTGSGNGGFNSTSFSAVVSGANYDDVLKTSDALMSRLKKVPDLVNVTSDAARAKPEIRVDVDPAKALAHGTTAAQVAGQVRNLLTSQKVTEITLDSRTYDVQATYDQNTLNNLDAIKSIKVGTVSPAPLSEVANVTQGDGPVSITRVNQERAVTVKGTINSDSTSGVNREAQQAINDLTAPGSDAQTNGTKITITGALEQQAQAFGQLGVALVVAIFLVYIVMVLTFGSLSTPFVIMFSLPLAAIGSIVALFVTGRPLGISALIGVLMLIGIVVTNAIVMLDLVEQLKDRGMSTGEALVEGGRTRVRPIVMTALATMIALMPLVLGFSEGSIIAAELGTVVVGGLFTSTFLTLIVVPVVYSLFDSIGNRLSGGRKTEEEVVEDHALENGARGKLDLEETAPAEPVTV